MTRFALIACLLLSACGQETSVFKRWTRASAGEILDLSAASIGQTSTIRFEVADDDYCEADATFSGTSSAATATVSAARYVGDGAWTCDDYLYGFELNADGDTLTWCLRGSCFDYTAL